MIGHIGSIVSWTIIRVPPGEFTDQAPYPVVLVQLNSGKKVIAQLVDYEDAHIRVGQSVVTIVRRVVQPNVDGVIPYGIKVKPL